MFNRAPGDSVAAHWTHAVDGIFAGSTLLAELPIAGDALAAALTVSGIALLAASAHRRKQALR